MRVLKRKRSIQWIVFLTVLGCVTSCGQKKELKMEDPKSQTMDEVRKIIVDHLVLEEGVLENDTAFSSPEIGFDGFDLAGIFVEIEEKLEFPEDALDEYFDYTEEDIGDISIRHIAKAVEQIRDE